VFQVEQLIEQGVFPGNITEKLRERLGTTLVIPTTERGIFWFEDGRFEQKFRGHHGGLSREELLIPLFALEL
jgi:hypothetical protein